jgi:rhodanese-related sulfurtransferase
MPVAPLIDAAEPETTTDSSIETRKTPALHLVRALPPVPVARVTLPSAPTARIHWIGGFVHLRHPADLYAEIADGSSDLVVVDARFRESYAREHLPGAVNLPLRDLTEENAAGLSRHPLYVVYCWDDSCRASSKVAARMRTLGLKVDELHGGLQAWKKQGYPTERG